jgi:hypothetical protein
VQDANYVNGDGNYYFQNGANIEIAQWQYQYVQPGYYKVTNYDPASQYKTFTLEVLTAPSFTVAKQNSPVTDETNNMKAKLIALDSNSLSTYYDTMECMDLSNVTISTDHKYEVLMGA